MRVPPPTPSQEGDSFVFERVRDCVAHPFDPWSLRASTEGASPQKKRSPLLGGGRGWAFAWFKPLVMALFVALCATNTPAEDLQIKDTATGEVFYITVVPGSRALVARSNKATLSGAKLQSAATPSITALTLDGKTIEPNDYVALRPTLKATLSPGTSSDISSYNMRIVDALTQTVIASTTNVLSPVATGMITPEFAMTSDLTGGVSYIAIVSARDASGLETRLTSPVFRVEVGFKLHGLINGPNPFNPNQEATYIEYQLTKDADVTVYVYTIAGERIWTREVAAGHPEGGTAGFNSLMWNGRNHYGETVANGVYIAYVVAKHGGDKATGKIKMAVLK
jgi:hypothetical protein